MELWESDGPTKSLQTYMSYFQFIVPDTWNGYRDIDEKLNFEELNKFLEEEEEGAGGAGDPNHGGNNENGGQRNIES